MENKINIAELLKDCPQGMELNCTMFENTYFDYVDVENNLILCYSINDNIKTGLTFSKYGTYSTIKQSKCVIFPKGKTTWEGFVPPCKFKAGDAISIIVNNRLWYGIYQKEFNNILYCYVDYSDSTQTLYPSNDNGTCQIDDIVEMRLATEEEKQKLFDAIKANGYKWNAETKTLEKLPKFKVGDRIKHISAYTSGIVVKVDDKGYHIDYPKGEGVCYINFTLEKDYELAPQKFDITTLKPFDSRVLARDDGYSLWQPCLWGLYDKGHKFPYITIGNRYRYCIPYKGNEHLLGSTNDCDEHYKTWEQTIKTE